MVKKSIRELAKSAVKNIDKREYNNPNLDIQLMLMHILNKDKMYLLTHPEDLVCEEDEIEFWEMVRKRNSGYPLQYMTNKQEFMGLEFFVKEGVLIPRPDTEAIVETVIEHAKEILLKNEHNEKNYPKILDIGTGSGSIALSLAHYIPNSDVSAIDVSPIAIEVATENIKRLKLNNVKVIKGDLFDDLNLSKDIKYDVIVSNPPYIKRLTIQSLQTEVAVYEPKLALDGGQSGLIFYEKIAELSSELLGENGMLCLEIGHDQGKSVPKILEKTDIFKEIVTIKDLSGNDRVVKAIRKK